MPFLELAKMRYSVRDFKPTVVEPEKIQVILEAGRIAPTGANKQPQRILVITQQRGLEKISKAAKIFGAPLVVLICAEGQSAWVRPHDGKNIFETDAAIVTDHMMLQATELGLGSVWICHFKTDVIRSEFNLPPTWEPLDILAIGYPNEPANGMAASPDRHQTTRKPLVETVFFENPPSTN